MVMMIKKETGRGSGQVLGLLVRMPGSAPVFSVGMLRVGAWHQLPIAAPAGTEAGGSGTWALPTCG